VKREIVLIVALLALYSVAGCHSSPPSRFYTLKSTAAPGQTQSAIAYSVVVGPITVPAIIDRPQIVVYHGTSDVTLAEQSRWAEPVASGIVRAVAGNLAQLLGGAAQVSAVPQMVSANPDYRVVLDVQRFEPVLGREATIEVLWTVLAAKGGASKSGRSLVRETTVGDGYDAIVAAFDRSLLTVSSDIAAAIRSLPSVP
jgi:uncharacterized protein